MHNAQASEGTWGFTVPKQMNSIQQFRGRRRASPSCWVVLQSLMLCGLTPLMKSVGSQFLQDENIAYSMKCNIANDTNYLHQGLQLGLVEDREKNSENLGRLALFKGSSQVTQLPPYLTVQLVRFFYKAEARQKAKILRKVCSKEGTAAWVCKGAWSECICCMIWRAKVVEAWVMQKMGSIVSYIYI